ncbi:MAG: alpha/beta hydrolase [Cyanobacteria bacterium P01_G01_bin.49]
MKKQTIKIGEYTAAYTSVGQGTPIIFLHGFFGDSSTLKPLIKEFQDNYHCISLDLLGFGESSKPNINYLIETQVNFLQQFITILKVPSFYLIGYSYGGWVASAYATSYQQFSDIKHLENIVLKQLILIAPAGIRDDKFVGRYNHLKPLLLESPLIDFGLIIIAAMAKLIKKDKEIKFIREIRQTLLNQPAAKAMISNRLKPEDAVDTVEKNIHEIAIPTLIIAAENDNIIPLWHSQTYADLIPQASLNIIKEADHNLIHSHSQKISQFIKNSLDCD